MLILKQKAILQVWTKTVLTLHLQCLVITFPGWYHLGITAVPEWKQANWLGKGHSTNSGKNKKVHFKISDIFVPKNHILSLSERQCVLFDAKTQTWHNKKMTSQSTHFTKLEYTHHGPVIYFFACRSTNIIQLFCCYVLNWAHNVWKSHGTTVTSPGSTAFMLNSKDTILLVLVLAKTLQRRGSSQQCWSLKHPSYI